MVLLWRLERRRYTITLTDTVTGAEKQYQNQQGNLCELADTSAVN